MKQSYGILTVLVLLAKGFMAETSVATQASNTLLTCDPKLETILRLERAVNNMSWELKLTKADLKTTNIELKTAKSDFQTTTTDLVSTKAALKYTEDKLEEMIYEIANLTKEKGVNRDVSFQVKLNKNPYIPGQKEPLKFDRIDLNRGDGYNPTSGIFTVPRTGTYLCWSNILSTGKNYFDVRLMKEGKQMVRSYTGTEQRPGTTSITYLMTCEKGDHVWFFISGSSLSIYGHDQSSFGCILITL